MVSVTIQPSMINIYSRDVNSIENKLVETNSAAIVCIELSTDERTAACGTEDGVLAVWDLDACRCLWTVSFNIR